MVDLKGTPGELRMTIEIKRAATGKVETYELTGTPVEDDSGKEKNERNSSSL